MAVALGDLHVLQWVAVALGDLRVLQRVAVAHDVLLQRVAVALGVLHVLLRRVSTAVGMAALRPWQTKRTMPHAAAWLAWVWQSH